MREIESFKNEYKENYIYLAIINSLKIISSLKNEELDRLMNKFICYFETLLLKSFNSGFEYAKIEEVQNQKIDKFLLRNLNIITNNEILNKEEFSTIRQLYRCMFDIALNDENSMIDYYKHKELMIKMDKQLPLLFNSIVCAGFIWGYKK